jgi:hypothetical protein
MVGNDRIAESFVGEGLIAGIKNEGGGFAGIVDVEVDVVAGF